MNKVLQRLKSKTYIAGLVGLTLTAIELHSGAILSWMPESLRMYAVFAWPMAMFTLREVTSSALSDK